MVWRTHENGHKIRNSRVETPRIFYLLHVCNGRNFLSHLPYIGIQPLGKRHFYHAPAERF
jgi:hypothetical protein